MQLFNEMFVSLFFHAFQRSNNMHPYLGVREGQSYNSLLERKLPNADGTISDNYMINEHTIAPFYMRGQLPGCGRYREAAEGRMVQIARRHSEEAEWDRGKLLLESKAGRASHKVASHLQGRLQDKKVPPGYEAKLSRRQATGRPEEFIR